VGAEVYGPAVPAAMSGEKLISGEQIGAATVMVVIGANT
jgi:hypothetical protein